MSRQQEVFAAAEHRLDVDQQQIGPGEQGRLRSDKGRPTQPPAEPRRDPAQGVHRGRHDRRRRRAEATRGEHNGHVQEGDQRRVGLDHVDIGFRPVEHPPGHVEVPRLVLVRRQHDDLGDPRHGKSREGHKYPAAGQQRASGSHVGMGRPSYRRVRQALVARPSSQPRTRPGNGVVLPLQKRTGGLVGPFPGRNRGPVKGRLRARSIRCPRRGPSESGAGTLRGGHGWCRRGSRPSRRGPGRSGR